MQTIAAPEGASNFCQRRGALARGRLCARGEVKTPRARVWLLAFGDKFPRYIERALGHDWPCTDVERHDGARWTRCAP